MVSELIKLVGADIIIQVGGGVWEHPDGGKAGSLALRQAIDAALSGRSLEDAAGDKRSLEANDTWGLSTYE